MKFGKGAEGELCGCEQGNKKVVDKEFFTTTNNLIQGKFFYMQF